MHTCMHDTYTHGYIFPYMHTHIMCIACSLEVAYALLCEGGGFPSIPLLHLPEFHDRCTRFPRFLLDVAQGFLSSGFGLWLQAGLGFM